MASRALPRPAAALLLLLVLAALSEGAKKVAIIGSGIGGSSLAHFLRQQDRSIQVTVFEREDEVGGRARNVMFDNQTFEAGAAVIHEMNTYMKGFVKDLKLKVSKELYNSSEGVGFFDGHKLAFAMRKNFPFQSKLQALWRYGWDLVRMRSFVNDLLDNFLSIYDLQKRSIAFESPEDLLHALNLFSYTRHSLAEVLHDKGFSKLFIDEFATAIMRINYGQNASINAFAGGVSLAASNDDDLWRVQGGNQLVCSGLLKLSGAEVHTFAQVKSISKDDSVYTVDAAGLGKRKFDYVALALPLETSGIDFLGELNDTIQVVPPRHMQITHATFFTAAGLNGTSLCDSKWSCKSAVPSVILTTDSDHDHFSSIGPLGSLDANRSRFVYKVFSKEELSSGWISKHFNDPDLDNVQRFVWEAYPVLKPAPFPPFQLAPGLFYLNALETAASALEMSAIASMNVALLITGHTPGPTRPREEL